MAAIAAAGYKPGEDVYLALDAAATEFYEDGRYLLKGEGKEPHIRRRWSPTYAELVANYPIVSIEDGMAEDDWDGWSKLTEALGSQVPARGRRSVRHQRHAAQAGHRARHRQRHPGQGQPDRHLTETLDAVRMAQKRGYTAVMSHRSGETEDATIADLAVATSCGQIKTGSLARSDRVAKYNQLLRIEEELGAPPAMPAARC